MKDTAERSANIIDWKERQVALAERRLEDAILRVEASRKFLAARQAELAERKARHSYLYR